MHSASRRRSYLAPSEACIPAEDTAQVFSLAFAERPSAPAAPTQHRLDDLGACTISFLDLVDAADGESLR